MNGQPEVLQACQLDPLMCIWKKLDREPSGYLGHAILPESGVDRLGYGQPLPAVLLHAAAALPNATAFQNPEIESAPVFFETIC